MKCVFPVKLYTKSILIAAHALNFAVRYVKTFHRHCGIIYHKYKYIRSDQNDKDRYYFRILRSWKDNAY